MVERSIRILEVHGSMRLMARFCHSFECTIYYILKLLNPVNKKWIVAIVQKK